LAAGGEKSGVLGDALVGAALGPVFSTCSPTYFLVLAAVLPQQPLVGLVYLIAYALGLSLALFGIALAGQKLVKKLRFASNPSGTFKRTLGALFIVVGVAIISGLDKKVEAGILGAGFFDVTKIEQQLLGKVAGNMGTADGTTSGIKLAPELVAPSGYINTNGQPIKLADYRGKKVVLLDVWTYSCINCQRTLPYLKAWYEKYKDQGLEIVGLHTPEFAFEKNIDNVKKAVQEFGIQYPVVLDNDFATWNAYGNKYWPRKYLIDLDGHIIYDHIGEGNYEETERAIQKALRMRNERLMIAAPIRGGTAAPADRIASDASRVNSPETYFGARRNTTLGNGSAGKIGAQNFTLPAEIKLNALYLGGQWDIQAEFAKSTGKGNTVVFRYQSQHVYMVASAPGAGAKIRILLDGKRVANFAVKDHRLYSIIDNGNSADTAAHTLTIETDDPGFEIYTFTFG
jgi:thiol-disulfide isomerase/thioredoxin